ncbi:hypothetical protein ASD88_18760 [Pelomonas sp. Root662]|nr:hypothetical protein ASC81_14600 [Pelomonas sp. Root405]KRA70157.1 hypothetical protein ASD88_18760 [Pelomonas sp. Root662]
MTPTLRWWAWRGAFVEVGIGATVTSRVYETDGKRFSSRFNFGSHLGAGWSLDDKRSQELVVRIEHYSNGGFRRPNPGENFLQVRYAHRF